MDDVKAGDGSRRQHLGLPELPDNKRTGDVVLGFVFFLLKKEKSSRRNKERYATE